MADRLLAARAWVAQKPTDRFGLYALAMELRGPGSWSECFEVFDRLLASHPNYAVGYYHYAVSRRRAGDRAGALSLIDRGLAVAQKDPKTSAELQDLKNELEDAGDEEP